MLLRRATPIGLALALAALVLLVFAHAPQTLAAETGSGAATPDTAPLVELPDLVLAPWLKSQTKNGNFKRPSGTVMNDGYANAGLGYAMLLEAARSGNLKYFNSAMKAFNWINRTRYPMFGVFYQMFSAAAYNVARENFGSRMAFRRIRTAWANKLRRFPYQRGVLGSTYRYNKNLVEALQVIELYRTGLRTSRRGSIVRDRRLAIRRAVRLMNVQVPRQVSTYSNVVGPLEGWPGSLRVAEMSDPPDNPPAYNALSAALYERSYARLPIAFRTERMRQTAGRMIDGVISRVAPDGDLAFDGRSQEQAWALSSAAFAAWNATDFEVGEHRAMHLSFARRVVSRLENVHVTPKSSFGFVLTPAAGCCDRRDMPPGQDHYYDVGKYSGLTALTLGWALEERPLDWATGNQPLPTDRLSDFIFKPGRGSFYQHSAPDLYWLVRMRSDYYDARADSGLAVLKQRTANGQWVDAVPPRPYTGGHHRPADPAAPCLLYRSGCAYLELSGGTQQSANPFRRYKFVARWRTARGTLVRTSSAWIVSTADGLVISLNARKGDGFRLDTFLAGPRCSNNTAVTTRLSVTIGSVSGCSVAKTVYAGGALTTLRKVRLNAAPKQNGQLDVSYTVKRG